MLRAFLNKSWRQHPTRHQLYGHLPPITKTIQVRRTRHAGHCWRSRDELISDVPLWTPTHGRAKAGRTARTYIQQLYEDTGCCPEDLPEAMNDREKWRERVRDIHATSTTWWWFVSFIILIYWQRLRIAVFFPSRKLQQWTCSNETAKEGYKWISLIFCFIKHCQPMLTRFFMYKSCSYIYMCVCMCVCVWISLCVELIHV